MCCNNQFQSINSIPNGLRYHDKIFKSQFKIISFLIDVFTITCSFGIMSCYVQNGNQYNLMAMHDNILIDLIS